MPTPVPLVTDDGLSLEAELAVAPDGAERCGMVLCHPHPQFGGTMRSIVISALFDALPPLGVTCLRFNFRGVEGSEGSYDEGNLERVDVEAAVAELGGRVAPEAPLVLAGWSFGADMALSVREARVAAWLAIAPPLRFVHDLDGLGADARPKLLVLGQHDEVKDPAEVRDSGAALGQHRVPARSLAESISIALATIVATTDEQRFVVGAERQPRLALDRDDADQLPEHHRGHRDLALGVGQPGQRDLVTGRLADVLLVGPADRARRTRSSGRGCRCASVRRARPPCR